MEPEFVISYVLPGPETQSAYYDQRHDNDVDGDISGVAGEGGERLVFSHKIKACVTERGH